MQKRHYRNILTIALLCASLLLMVSWWPLAGDTPTASAHAFVVGSDPIDSSTISKPPAEVRIYFDAPVASASRAVVNAYTISSAKVLVSTGPGTVNASNPRELDIPLLPSNKLPQGGYEVRWTAVSLTDGHATSGLIGFNLGISNTGVDGTPNLGPSTSNHFPQLSVQGILAVAWDWLVILALLFWTGILITETMIIPRVMAGNLLTQARKHSRPLQVLCLAGLLVGEVINLVLRATSFTQLLGDNGINPDTLAQFVLNTNYGHFWLARVVLLACALFFFWWSGKRQHQADATSPGPQSRNKKRFRQLRQQVRAESASENAGASSHALSTLTRSQARVSGAVAANASPARSTTSAQPRISPHNTLAETLAEQFSPWYSGSWLALAGLVMLSLVLSNELIQLTSLPLSAGLLSWLSLVAQATWFGGMAYLGFTLLPLPLAANPDQRAETQIRVLKRARPFLFSATGVLLVSELFLNEATIQTPGQLFTTPYGRALLTRDVLLVLMFALTAYVFFVLLPRLQRQAVLLPVVAADMPARRTRTFKLEKTGRAIKRTLQAFSGLAALTLICVALMNFFAPPVVFPNVDYNALVQQAQASAPAASPTPQTRTAGDLSITLQVAPARAGASNTLALTLNDAQGKALTNATVKLAINMQIMDMGTAATTLTSGTPAYTTTFKANQTFTMAGVWVIQVEIDRPGQPAVNTTFQVMVTA
ncbi:MAG TPA: copper resistance protein CopC [Ktedonobacteraceae bacterium]